MNLSILVKMDYDRGYVGIRTVDHAHSSSKRFLIADHLLSRVFDEQATGSLCDYDLGNFVKVWRNAGMIKFRFVWLQSFSDNSVRGYEQLVSVPEEKIAELLDIHTPFRYLFKLPPQSAKIDTTEAQVTLKRIQQNKRVKRALSKALRSCFQWQGDIVYLFNDGNYDFFFTTDSGFPKNGGLILHHGTRGDYPYVRYSVHT